MVAVGNGRPVVVVAVNDKRPASAGIKAGELVRTAAGSLGGGGGGKDDVAQGGGTDPAKVDEALAAGRAHRRPAGHRQRLTVVSG